METKLLSFWELFPQSEEEPTQARTGAVATDRQEVAGFSGGLAGAGEQEGRV